MGERLRGMERERARDAGERDEQSAEVEQTNLSVLSDDHQQPALTAEIIMCNLALTLHNDIILLSTSVDAL